MRLAGIVAAATVLILLAGCAGLPEMADNYPAASAAWVHQDVPEWQLTPDAAVHSQATLAATLAAIPPLPADTTVEDYVRLALQHNPGIRAAEANVRRLIQRISQVTSLDDPMLSVAPVGDMAETATGQVGAMVGVSQKIPFPGKLSAKGRIAAQDVAAAAEDLEQTRLAVIADTRQAYWSYAFSTQALAVTRENRELLSQFRSAASARYRANLAVQQDVLRASVELSNIDNELLTLEQKRQTAAALLNSLLDRPVTAPLPEPRPIALKRITLQLDRLLAIAVQASPELAKVKARLQAERERLTLAKLQRLPDFTLGVEYNIVEDKGIAMSTNGKDQWWLTFGLNLPIWPAKLSAGEREARAGIAAAAATLTAAQDRIAFRVQDALTRVETQQRLVILFRDVIIPQARQTLDASTSSYQAGKTDFLTLVDNARKLLSYQLMYYQGRADFEKAYAQLEQTIGHDLRRPTTAPATQPAAPRATRPSSADAP